MEPTGQSPVFATIERIQKQIAELRSKLSPVIRNLPTSVKESAVSNTELLGRFHEIEDSLEDLNGIIEL